MYKSIIFILFIVVSVSWAGEDYYKLLGIDRTADQRDIRKAFKKLAVTEHPDKNTDDPNAHAKFIKLTTAYEILKDPDLRKKYDVYGEEGLDESKRRSSNYHSYTYYQNNFGIYDDDPQIITLNRNDYFDSVQDSEKVWFVNFYSPQCSHCHTLAPVWRKIAKDLEGVIRVGAVNCEDDWNLCNQVGIQSYPTLLYYPTNSKHGASYYGEKTYEAIMRYVLDDLDVDIREISESVLKIHLKSIEENEKPTLIFVHGEDRYSFTEDERLRVAGIFDKMIDIRMYDCKSFVCDLVPDSSNVIYIPPKKKDVKVKPIFFNDIVEVEDLVKKILELLPEPTDINEEEFKDILDQLKLKSNDGWLICFYIGHATDFDVLLKQLPSVLKDVNLAKVNCGRYSSLCKNLNVNHYPAWGVLKPGGAFEMSHGKSTMNDVANFAKNSLKAKNVWALSADKIHSILGKKTGEAWFLDWYAPWCPPCMRFLPEVRKASLEFEPSVLHFGTIDCTIHSEICKQYNIRSYPTAMLVNGSSIHQYASQKTAQHIIDFIKETVNPTVLRITSKNFDQTLGKKRGKHLWVVDFFAPWCGPCQQLAPEWTAVAKTLKILKNVKIANVDCEAEKSLCAQQSIRSYPTIRLYPLGSDGLNSVALYKGQRDSTSLLRWIIGFFSVKVLDFNDSNLERTVLKSKDPVLVDYYAPWCGHCITMEPEYAIAAQLLEGKVTLARLNCDHYHYYCSQAGIRAYPTLKLYTTRSSRKTLQDGFKLESTTAEEIAEEALALLPKRSSSEHDEL